MMRGNFTPIFTPFEFALLGFYATICRAWRVVARMFTLPKRLLLGALLAVGLAACVPSWNGPSANDASNYTAGLQPLTLERKGANVEVVFNAGLQPAEEGALTIGGTALVLLAPLDGSCSVSGAVIGCSLPTVPALRSFVVTVAGTGVRAVVSFYRPNGIVLVGPVRGVPLVK